MQLHYIHLEGRFPKLSKLLNIMAKLSVTTWVLVSLLTSTSKSKSTKPDELFDEQHRALRTPSHSELSLPWCAVTSAHNTPMSYNLQMIQ